MVGAEVDSFVTKLKYLYHDKLKPNLQVDDGKAKVSHTGAIESSRYTNKRKCYTEGCYGWKRMVRWPLILDIAEGHVAN